LSNNGEADIFGFELAATWKPFPWCSLWCAYTFFKSYFERRPTWYAEVPEVRAPQNQLALRSSLDLPHNLRFDTALFVVEGLKVFKQVSGYARLDLRLAWRPWGDDRLEVELGVRNLTDQRHYEYKDEVSILSSRIERSVYAALSVRF